MSTIGTALSTLAVSVLFIIALCLGDPKRRRAIGRKDQAMRPRQRRVLTALAYLPGLGCVVLGNPAAFMLWLGGCALVGWSCAAWPYSKP